jgi:hypothetical protein
MEGAYNKVLQARQATGNEYFSYFLESISSTVRCAGMLLQGEEGRVCVWWRESGHRVRLSNISHSGCGQAGGVGVKLEYRQHGYVCKCVFPCRCPARDEVASCSERAYKSLSLADAQRMLLFPTGAELVEYAAQVSQLRAWLAMLGWSLVHGVALHVHAGRGGLHIPDTPVVFYLLGFFSGIIAGGVHHSRLLDPSFRAAAWLEHLRGPCGLPY